jgi:hypothetical protein
VDAFAFKAVGTTAVVFMGIPALVYTSFFAATPSLVQELKIRTEANNITGKTVSFNLVMVARFVVKIRSFCNWQSAALFFIFLAQICEKQVYKRSAGVSGQY